MKLFSRRKQSNGYIVNGVGNILEIPEETNINLRINGNNNKVKIGKNTSTNYLLDLVIDGDNNEISFENVIKGKVRVVIGNSKDLPANNCSAKFGKDLSVTDTTCLVLYEHDSHFECGDDVMISHGVTMRGSDGHAILSPQGEVLNRSHGIKIGSHVWIAQDVLISKNTQIPSGCIVGTKAVVTKKFTQENCILAGVPAKIVKENIKWVHESPDRC